jgi:hypothetical protein
MAALEREMQPVAPFRLDARLDVLKIPCCTRTPEIEKQIEEFRRNREKLGNLERAAITSYETWDKDGRIADVPVQCLRIGDIALVGLPAEVFTAVGLELKRGSPAAQTFVVECANEKIGYVPPRDQAHRGAYGERPIQTRHLVEDAAEKMVASALASLGAMWGGKQAGRPAGGVESA